MSEPRTLPPLRLIAVCSGRAQGFTVGERKFRSAILKAPVSGRVALTADGVAGDQQADRRFHGGTEKAVYLCGAEHYAAWAAALATTPWPPGTLGENLTLGGAAELERVLCVGDTLQLGTGHDAPQLELTTPRQPCWKLETRIGIAGFAKAFVQSRRLGSYARVVRSGTIAAGDPVTLVARQPRAATLHDLIGALHLADHAAQERVLAQEGLPAALRRKLERALRERSSAPIDAGETG